MGCWTADLAGSGASRALRVLYLSSKFVSVLYSYFFACLRCCIVGCLGLLLLLLFCFKEARDACTVLLSGCHSARITLVCLFLMS